MDNLSHDRVKDLEKTDTIAKIEAISRTESDETVESRENAQPLSLGRLVVVGACMTLTSIINGWSVIMTPIMLELLADGLHLAENNLQWTLNSLLLPLVSNLAHLALP